MLAIPGYTLDECIHEGPNLVIYRAKRISDGRSVVIKGPAAPRPERADRERIHHEFRVLQHLAPSRHAPAPIAIELVQNRPFLVVEHVHGSSLAASLSGPVDIESGLRLSIAVARALSDLHGRHVIHKNIRPDNIVITGDGMALFIDFGISSMLPRERAELVPLESLGDRLPYMSPEQTGRTSQAIDSRTDLYSLGVVLYQLFCGRLPFRADGPMEWCHCHLAREVKPPFQVRAEIPEPLSAILLKLLAKRPDSRYQSAAGLERDLIHCSEEWQRHGRITHFELGEHDHCLDFHIPAKLYGREEQARRLRSYFRDTAEDGRCRIVTVAGAAGIGKTSLVYELHSSIVEAQGNFLSGKFDQYRRDIPYQTLFQALQGFFRQILSQSESAITRWRTRFEQALGANAHILCNIIPELAILLGQPTTTPELRAGEARKRFHMVIKDLIRSMATAEEPLVIFLDDMQWADVASMPLLRALIEDSSIQYVTLILAYRDNEVDDHHPFMLALRQMATGGVPVHQLGLRELDPDSLRELVADSLRITTVDARPLAELVGSKTKGNPFFVRSFLQDLFRKNLIRWEARERRFLCDLAAIAAQDYTDNVVEFMLDKLVELPDATKESLQVAAFLGNTFLLSELARVQGAEPESVAQTLWPALIRQLIAPIGDAYKVAHMPANKDSIPFVKYRFQHDRIRQAAYSLVPASERETLHLTIGIELLEYYGVDDAREQVFAILSHLNEARHLIREPALQRKLAQLNSTAAVRSKAAAAFERAASLFRITVSLLPPESWDDDREFAFDTYLACAECCYLTGDEESAQGLLDILLQRAKTLHERSAIYRMRINCYATKADMRAAVGAGIEFLKTLDIEFPKNPTTEDRKRAYGELWQVLGDRSVSDLIDLPTMTDERMLAAMEVLSLLWVPAHYFDANLYTLFLCRMVSISIQYGTCTKSAYAYVGLACALCDWRVAEYRLGYQFGKLAYDLVNRHEIESARAFVGFSFGDIVRIYSEPLASNRSFLYEALRIAQEQGDLISACYTCNHIITNMLATADHLDAVWETSEKLLAFVRRAADPAVECKLLSQQRFVQNMRGQTQSFSSLSDASFSEAAFEKRIADSQVGLIILWHYILKMHARLLSGDIEEAKAALDKCRTMLWSDPWNLELTNYFYIASLTLARHYDHVDASTRAEYRATLREYEHQLRQWADACPQNFYNRYALVRAELARIDGQDIEAMRWYEDAISTARSHGFVQNEAMALETAARYYSGRGLNHLAEPLLLSAYQCYLEWGAAGKARQLEETYSFVRTATQVGGAPGQAEMGANRSLSRFDVLSLVKANQAISSEIVLDKLIGTLLSVIRENVGATRAALILLSQSDGLVYDGTSRPLPLGDHDHIPQSIISFVRRTRESVVLDDTADYSVYSSDPYIEREQIKSVLCLPIIRRDSVVAVLYVENRLLQGVFTRAHLEVVKMLAAQAAISLDNALLYAEMEHRVEERTRALKEAQEQLMETARLAGMAEIASEVIHNVGNSLTSILLGVQRMKGLWDVSKLRYMPKTIELLLAHQHDLNGFLRNDPKGKHLIRWLEQIQGHFIDERNAQIGELDKLSEHLRFIQRIVEEQESYTNQITTMYSVVDLGSLLRNAVSIHEADLAKSAIVVEYHLEGLPPVEVDKHKVLQILLNLISNAKEAIQRLADTGAGGQGRIRVELRRLADEVHITIADNGIGISAANLNKIFEQGFSADGSPKSFRLHSGFLTARQMGGSLSALSGGQNQGATFTLVLPYRQALRR